MRKELFLVGTIAILFVLSACTATQVDEPQDVSSDSSVPEVLVAEVSESNEADSGTSDSESQSALAEEKPATEAASADPATGTQGQASESSEQDSEQAAADNDTEQSEVDRPAWQHLALTNARTGESFTLADFAGKTVFVEPMATWCSNCRRQLNNVREASYQLAGYDVVLVALSLETNIDDTTLANYASSQGFDWLFAVITPELLVELADEFGRAIANPPATPHFVIRADGTTTDLVTGIEPAAQILSQIAAAQG
jgi:thiol-disulfide isomerase/thioredoxin